MVQCLIHAYFIDNFIVVILIQVSFQMAPMKFVQGLQDKLQLVGLLFILTEIELGENKIESLKYQIQELIC